jgi:hypothetical protein
VGRKKKGKQNRCVNYAITYALETLLKVITWAVCIIPTGKRLKMVMRKCCDVHTEVQRDEMLLVVEAPKTH